MQMQMTERDKKLIVFLGVFVIVVVIGYWGIFPILKQMTKINEDMQSAQITREENEMKVAQLPMLEKEREELEESISLARKEFFPMMTSDEVDKYLTGLILDHGLEAIDLTIVMPGQEASLLPYQYAVLPEDTIEAVEMTEEKEDAEELSGSSEEDSMAPHLTDQPSTGVFAIDISMRVGGKKDALQQLIDEFSTQNNIYLKGYSWDISKSVQIQDDGTFSLVDNQTVMIDLSLFMCEE